MTFLVWLPWQEAGKRGPGERFEIMPKATGGVGERAYFDALTIRFMRICRMRDGSEEIMTGTFAS